MVLGVRVDLRSYNQKKKVTQAYKGHVGSCVNSALNTSILNIPALAQVTIQNWITPIRAAIIGLMWWLMRNDLICLGEIGVCHNRDA